MNKYYKRFKDKCFDVIGKNCVKCNSTEKLEIDHKKWEDKDFAISSCWSTKSWDEILVELAKCQPLCKSCHKEKSKIDLRIQKTKDRSLLHGTESQYTRYKCRCQLCKDNHNAWRRNHRRKIGETSGKIKVEYKKARCGSNSMYRNGCRCDLCKKAHTLQAIKYRKEKKSKDVGMSCKHIK